MTYFDFKLLRQIDLNSILTQYYKGVEYETKPTHNTRKYLLPSGQKVAVTGLKWIENNSSHGGVGALDLIIFLNSVPLLEAAELLYKFQNHYNATSSKKDTVQLQSVTNIPIPCLHTWEKVKYYLTNIRKIPLMLINELYNRNLIWSDSRYNCVFPRDLNSGAYLRGTNPNIPFKSTIGVNGMPYHIPGSDVLIITEAPIDSVSLKYYYPNATVIATGGRIGIDKIQRYLIDSKLVLLAHDNDMAGDLQANFISKTLKLQYDRLRPLHNLKDWNEVLINDSNSDLILPKVYFFPY
jgi:hypothetical protein